MCLVSPALAGDSLLLCHLWLCPSSKCHCPVKSSRLSTVLARVPALQSSLQMNSHSQMLQEHQNLQLPFLQAVDSSSLTPPCVRSSYRSVSRPGALAEPSHPTGLSQRN